MSEIRVIEGELTASGARFAILATRFNHFIVDSLLAGAKDALRRHGAKDEEITVIYVPGAFELPLVAQRVAALEEYDAIIALGAVIRGSTAHLTTWRARRPRGLPACRWTSTPR